MPIAFRRLARTAATAAIAGLSPGLTDRAAVAATYLRLEARRVLGPGRKASGKARLIGADMSFSDPAALVLLFEEIFVRRVYEVGPLPSAATIVDCGANIGMATLFFRRRYPGCHVLAFEPDPRVFGLLEANIAANGWRDVDARNAAVGAKDSWVDFYTVAANPAQLTMSTVAATVTAEAAVQRVPCLTLSAQLPDHVDLLKLDIEGAEREVLDELERSGAIERVQRVAMEYHHHVQPGDDQLSGMLALLERNGFGYTLSAIDWPGDVTLQSTAGTYRQNVMIYAYRSDGQGASI